MINYMLFNYIMDLIWFNKPFNEKWWRIVLEITGCKDVDKVLAKSLSTLFYGEAGVGKTSLLLTIARNMCVETYPCIYVSTEDTLHYDKIARYSEFYENVLFIEIRDFQEFFEKTLNIFSNIKYRVLFIDSVNSLYRLVAYSEDSLAKYGLLLGVFRKRSIMQGSYLFSTAQVRAGFENDKDEIVASGMSILEYWFDNIVFLGFEDGKRFLKFVKPDIGLKKYFIINDHGVTWVD